MTKRLAYFFLMTLVLYACKSSRISTVAPKESYTFREYKPVISEVNIPVEIPVEVIRKKINTELKGLIYEDNDLNNNDQDNLKLKVWKEKEIVVQMNNDVISYNLPLKISGTYGFKLEKLGLSMSQYEDFEFSIDIKFKSKIKILQDWTVKSETEPDGYTWISKPVLKVSGLDIPMTFLADVLLKTQQATLAKVIDEQAGTHINLKQYADKTWEALQQPISLSDDPKVWLKISPAQFIISPIRAQNGKIRTALGLRAYTETVLGARPEVKGIYKLPSITLHTIPTDTFTVIVSSDISYTYATEMARKSFAGQEFTFNDGKYKVKIDSIDIYGQGEKLVVKAVISGTKQGTIYFKGVPFYDPATYTIAIKDLEFDLDTKDKLLKSADWLLHGKLNKMIEKYFVYSLKDDLKHSEKMIQKSLTNNHIQQGIVLNGTLKELVPQDILLTPTGIKAIVGARGKLEVKIDGL